MQLRQKPSLTYSGLTVVLSQPSRMDIKCGGLLSANGGRFFEACLRPDYNRFQCDIRVKEDRSDLIEGTKCIMLLGEEAMKSWLGDKAKDNTLGELRGSVFHSTKGVPIICSFSPQDCADLKDYEKQFNPLTKGDYLVSNPEDEYDGGGLQDKRRHGHTKRSNYGFWFDRDLIKIKHILKHGLPQRTVEPVYSIYPNSEAIINELSTTKNSTLYLDFETNSNLDPLCLGFSFGLPRITVFPFVNHRYEWAYGNLPYIVKALQIAVRDNLTVAHNGSKFDFRVLATKLAIPIRRVYDTLIAHHRCWPDVEKSLGHATSHLTWEPFHKDESSFGYNTQQVAEQLWRYCGKDVYTMILIKAAIDKHAKSVPGLTESIALANDAIRPYLISSLFGIQYDPALVSEIMSGNDKLMMQYLRLINLLIGEKTCKALRAKSIKAMPGSNAKCVYYFHDLLGYDKVAWGKPTKKGTRNPSLAKTAIFKLRQRYDNPVLDLVIAYRELAKESGSLKFTPLQYDNNTETNQLAAR